MTEEKWRELFGFNLKNHLKDARMTQEELAEEMGVTQSAISDYVNGRKLPGVRSILNMAYALSCDTDDLIDFGEMID